MNERDLIDFWARRLEADLSGFADKGSIVEVRTLGRRITASWYQRAEAIETVLVLRENAPRILEGEVEVPYGAFFAGRSMANLDALARVLLRRERESIYIEPRARLRGVASVEEFASFSQLINDATTPDDEKLSTTVVMVVAQPGAGKTWSLRNLVRQRADRFLKRLATSLYLYVDAQGRVLASLEEALSQELDDLSATFGYDAVPALVRMGLLVPVIDGFDELLGVAGQDDAYGSLSVFLEELDCRGSVLAAARSAYFESEIVGRLDSGNGSASYGWSISTVELDQWNDSDLRTYVELASVASSRTTSVESVFAIVKDAFHGAAAELKGRPLFVARVVELALEDERFGSESGLIDELVAKYLQREAREKLLSRNKTPLVSEPILRRLLTAVAEEMWMQERRQLDKRMLSEVVEYQSGLEGLDEESSRVLLARAPYLAFLSAGARNKVEFEHEVFFGEFLAASLSSRLRESALSLHTFLGRGALPPLSVLGIVQRDRAFASTDSFEEQVARLSEAAGITSSRSEQVRTNAGVVAHGLVRAASSVQDIPAGLNFSNLSFVGLDFDDLILREVTIAETSFLRCSFRRTSLRASRFGGAILVSPLVDPLSTRFALGLTLEELGIVGVRLQTDDGIVEVWSPSDLSAVYGKIDEHYTSVRDIGSAEEFIQDPELKRFVERLLRHAAKANPFAITDDDHATAAFARSDYWPRVRTALTKSGIVRVAEKAASGGKKEFFRRQVSIEAIRWAAQSDQGADQRAREFWALLAMG